MKNLIIFLFLTSAVICSAQIIDIPDANFKNALVNTKCVDLGEDGSGDIDADLNNDGEIMYFIIYEYKNCVIYIFILISQGSTLLSMQVLFFIFKSLKYIIL